RVIAGFGFWIFLLSDIVMFSALFASYAVLPKATAGGPTPAQLFDRRNVAMDRFSPALQLHLRTDVRGHQFAEIPWHIRWCRGHIPSGRLNLELPEFRDMIAARATPQRSAFLAAFFTLVGSHGLHVAIGLA